MKKLHRVLPPLLIGRALFLHELLEFSLAIQAVDCSLDFIDGRVDPAQDPHPAIRTRMNAIDMWYRALVKRVVFDPKILIKHEESNQLGSDLPVVPMPKERLEALGVSAGLFHGRFFANLFPIGRNSRRERSRYKEKGPRYRGPFPILGADFDLFRLPLGPRRALADDPIGRERAGALRRLGCRFGLRLRLC